MKEPLPAEPGSEEEEVAGLQQLVEWINAKGDTGEIRQILEEHQPHERDAGDEWLRP